MWPLVEELVWPLVEELVWPLVEELVWTLVEELAWTLVEELAWTLVEELAWTLVEELAWTLVEELAWTLVESRPWLQPLPLLLLRLRLPPHQLLRRLRCHQNMLTAKMPERAPRPNPNETPTAVGNDYSRRNSSTGDLKRHLERAHRRWFGVQQIGPPNSFKSLV